MVLTTNIAANLIRNLTAIKTPRATARLSQAALLYDNTIAPISMGRTNNANTRSVLGNDLERAKPTITGINIANVAP